MLQLAIDAATGASKFQQWLAYWMWFLSYRCHSPSAVFVPESFTWKRKTGRDGCRRWHWYDSHRFGKWSTVFRLSPSFYYSLQLTWLRFWMIVCYHSQGLSFIWLCYGNTVTIAVDRRIHCRDGEFINWIDLMTRVNLPSPFLSQNLSGFNNSSRHVWFSTGVQILLPYAQGLHVNASSLFFMNDVPWFQSFLQMGFDIAWHRHLSNYFIYHNTKTRDTRNSNARELEIF